MITTKTSVVMITTKPVLYLLRQTSVVTSTAKSSVVISTTKRSIVISTAKNAEGGRSVVFSWHANATFKTLKAALIHMKKLKSIMISVRPSGHLTS